VPSGRCAVSAGAGVVKTEMRKTISSLGIRDESVEDALRAASQGGVSRRRLLELLAWSGAGAVLGGCDPAPVPPPVGTPVPAQTAASSASAATSAPAATTAATATAAPSAVSKPTPASMFILHSGNNAEMRFEAMAGPGHVTPNARFFVRSHGTTPLLDARTWKLSIEGGGVERPFQLTYDELIKLPARTLARYVDCAGNGRSFYESLLHRKAKGDPWRLGGWGIAEWTGVPLSDLLRRAGIKPGAVDVMPVGLDDARIERPMPVAKAMEDDTLVVYRMNGEPLPAEHGFPARVLVPGWAGIASVKWVGAIRVSETPLWVKTNTEDYVLIGPDYPPQPPAKGPVITLQVAKSAVSLPWPATLVAGPQTLSGYAWSPAGKIARVDVSLDGGRTFRPARLVGPNIERAGVRWELEADVRPGDGTITPRATDDKGNTQPDVSAQRWNEKGYLFGAMVPHPVKAA
jgi:sulfane dehydrogenase subunit SoxC